MACSLNGTNQYLSTPVSSDFEFGTDDFTVSYTIKINSFSGYSPFHGIIFGSGSNGGVGLNSITCCWWLSVASSSLMLFRFDGTAELRNQVNFSFTTGITYNILATRLGTSLRLFIDGSQVGTSFTDSTSYNRAPPDGGTQDLYIGRSVTGYPAGQAVAGPGYGYYIQYSNANYSEVAIWKAGLNDDEITSLSKGFTPDQIRPQSLTFYLPLVSNIQDLRGAKTITNVNGATPITHPRIIS